MWTGQKRWNHNLRHTMCAVKMSTHLYLWRRCMEDGSTCRSVRKFELRRRWVWNQCHIYRSPDCHSCRVQWQVRRNRPVLLQDLDTRRLLEKRKYKRHVNTNMDNLQYMISTCLMNTVYMATEMLECQNDYKLNYCMNDCGTKER